jgi:hypothetical protein
MEGLFTWHSMAWRLVLVTKARGVPALGIVLLLCTYNSVQIGSGVYGNYGYDMVRDYYESNEVSLMLRFSNFQCTVAIRLFVYFNVTEMERSGRYFGERGEGENDILSM